jgi:hypothetical protein
VLFTGHRGVGETCLFVHSKFLAHNDWRDLAVNVIPFVFEHDDLVLQCLVQGL